MKNDDEIDYIYRFLLIVLSIWASVATIAAITFFFI
jgi:hypothetical protein